MTRVATTWFCSIPLLLAGSVSASLAPTAGDAAGSPEVEAVRAPVEVDGRALFLVRGALGDFCVTYELNVACSTPQKMPRLYTELHRAILDVFNEYGVQIMTPAYEGDPDRPKVVPREQWFQAPAAAHPPDRGGSGSGSR